MSDAPLLRVRGLKVHFPVEQGALFKRTHATVKAVDGIDLDLKAGQTLALVGESGCGKSTTGRALLQLIRPTAGQVEFDGRELTSLWVRRLGVWRWGPELRELRKDMQLIFQDPYASLNPRMTVEDIVGEPLLNFGHPRGDALRRRVQELLTQVGMDPRYVRRYPHEFSGGQRQRIGIARALALKPRLIVADEPISALDVSIQAQILSLLADLKSALGLTMLFVAHDLAAVRHLSDEIAVMYLGHIVERAPWDRLFDAPAHPYTRALLSAIPRPDPRTERTRQRITLQGEIPSPIHPPPGCTFHPRCPLATAECRQASPPLREIAPGHEVACFHA